MVMKTHLKNDVAHLGRTPNQYLVLNYVGHVPLRTFLLREIEEKLSKRARPSYGFKRKRGRCEKT